MRFRLWGLVICVLFYLNTVTAQRRPKDKILDRKVFLVTMEHQSDRKKTLEPFEEELSFRSNRMTAKHMRMSDSGGFQTGEYAISNKEEVMDEIVYHFEAINKNAKGMSLKWEGKVFGGHIEGIAIVSKNGKPKQEFAFTGSIKAK